MLITEADRKVIPQGRLLHAAKEKNAHKLWKRFLWGTHRDERLIERLELFSKITDLAGEADAKKRWIKGSGIKPDPNGTAKIPTSPWWPPEHLFIEANSPCLQSCNFLLKNDCTVVGNRFPVLDRSRSKSREIFNPPMVIFSQGFKKIVFSDFPVLFEHALQSIHGPTEDADLLLFLSAYLRSPLAQYYCFHVSSRQGIERNVVRLNEVLELPFPLPGEAPAKNAKDLVAKVANHLRSGREELLAAQNSLNQDGWLVLRAKHEQKLRSKLNQLVYEYFGILDNERWLIEDTIGIFAPSATPKTADEINIPTLCAVNEAAKVSGYRQGLQVYADVLTGTINVWAKEQKSKWRVQASGGIDQESGLALVKLQLASREAIFKSFLLENKLWNKLFQQFSEQQVALHHERQIFGLDINASVFYILRPLSLVHWTRTAALNDADEFYLQIKGGSSR